MVTRIAEQYARNASALRKMHAKAVATGRRVGGYTAAELEAHAAEYDRLARTGEVPALPR